MHLEPLPVRDQEEQPRDDDQQGGDEGEGHDALRAGSAGGSKNHESDQSGRLARPIRRTVGRCSVGNCPAFSHLDTDACVVSRASASAA